MTTIDWTSTTPIASQVDQALSQKSGKWNDMAGAVSKNLETSEDHLMRAFSLSDKDSEGITKLSTDLGFTSAQNLGALQVVAKNRYERSFQALSILNQLITNAHQTIMGIIQQLRMR